MTISYKSRFLEVDQNNRVFRVSRDAYRSQEVFEEEKEKILYKTWIVLGHESEIPNKNDFVTRQVIDRQLIFNRDRQGNVNVFYNSCRHRGPAVCNQKWGSAKSFKCPYHGWVYRNNGILASTGSTEADATYPSDYCEGAISLSQVKHVDSHAGFYFVNFSKEDEVEPLLDFLGESADRLDLINEQSAVGMEVVRGVHEYEINANYKLLCENSYDGYHLFTTHESYVEYMMQVLKGSDFDPGIKGICKTFGNGHACFETPIKAGRAVAQWLPTWGEEARELIDAKRAEILGRMGEERGNDICDLHCNMVIFPNSIINDQQTVLARTIIPVAANKMIVRAWSLAPADEVPALRKIRLENVLSFLGPAGFATPDDVSMLEWCQKAYESTDVEHNDFCKGFSTDEKTLKGDGAWDDEMQMRAYWLKWDEMMSA